MDARVDDFLNEINKIVPVEVKSEAMKWRQCFDEKSGFVYYWNTETDEVTWEVPEEHKKSFKSQNMKLYVPPKTELFGQSLDKIPKVKQDAVKIYKLNDNLKSNGQQKRKLDLSDTSSENNKIKLISNYGGESESEDEPKSKSPKLVNTESDKLKVSADDSPETDHSNSDNGESMQDESDILTQIQKRAMVLKELGGELPESVKMLVPENDVKVNNVEVNTSKLSLVAGYGDDSEEEQETNQSNTNITKEIAMKSTLFPIMDYHNEERTTFTQDNIDMKAFKRKKRIGIDLVLPHKHKIEDTSNTQESKFGSDLKSSHVEYPGFKSGGVLFAKSDSSENVKQTDNIENETACDRLVIDGYERDDKSFMEIKEIQQNLIEKLTFLSEGCTPALPVQIMIIQIETLYAALKDNSVKPSYVKKWLKETSEQLVNLEREAAPNGWLLQWERTHKRYYYYCQSTGESQWEYPHPDVIRDDMAMDICTTPPPPPSKDPTDPFSNEGNTAPLSPNVKSISPSLGVTNNLLEDKNNEDNQPLPPGVEISEVSANDKNSKDVSKDTMLTVLDSFYSDLASIESNVTNNKNSEEAVVSSKQEQPSPPPSIPTAKKKKKIKVAQGLAMKKKGVSTMVEKWKKVQNSYD